MTQADELIKAALNGGTFNFRDKSFVPLFDIQHQNAALLKQFNSEANPATRQELLAKITGRKVPDNVMVFPPLQTDFGRNIFLKSGVLINTDCLFDDAGGVYLDENVLIGPRVSLITLNHDTRPDHRDMITAKAIHIHKNAWLGTGTIVLPGVTIGENAIIGAGSVVTRDVPANSTYVGDPARPINRNSK